MSVTPEMPVSTGRNMAFLPLMTKTPWISSFLGSPVATGAGAASVTLLSFFPLFAASSRSLRERTASAWIGIAITLFFSAVLIFAVVERPGRRFSGGLASVTTTLKSFASWLLVVVRSEEHTSELQSRQYLVCRLLLEKK